jgi:hypothetical protein
MANRVRKKVNCYRNPEPILLPPVRIIHDPQPPSLAKPKISILGKNTSLTSLRTADTSVAPTALLPHRQNRLITTLTHRVDGTRNPIAPGDWAVLAMARPPLGPSPHPGPLPALPLGNGISPKGEILCESQVSLSIAMLTTENLAST